MKLEGIRKYKSYMAVIFLMAFLCFSVRAGSAVSNHSTKNQPESTHSYLISPFLAGTASLSYSTDRPFHHQYFSKYLSFEGFSGKDSFTLFQNQSAGSPIPAKHSFGFSTSILKFICVLRI